MAVYLTKTMLSKLKKVKYPVPAYGEDDSQMKPYGDPWQRLTAGKGSINLAKDMICRICAKDGPISISEKLDGIDIDIMGAICSITNVSMHADDSLPKFICRVCLESLKVAITFKKNCESSDRKFKHFLNPNGNPMYHSYPYSKHDFQLILHHMKQKRMKIEEKLEKERKKKEKMKQKRSLPKHKQFKCSPCDINFPNKEKLLAHRRERQCTKRACELCGQLVLSIAQHMRHIHKQSTLHKCPTCGKEFPVIARLRNHMLVHTNTFNFFCDLCPYRSKHKYYLVMHMRTHTGEKPYRCGDCPATFVNPSNLNKHKLTHQEKQFKCLLCEKAFRTASALREHHDAAHMNIKHQCQYCGRDFCYKSDLRKHEIRTHNRTKREFVGGEPSYKQVERMQKLQEEIEIEKLGYLRHDGEHIIEVPVTNPLVHTYTIEHKQEFVQTSQPIYFSDVTAIIQQQQQTVQQMVQPQTVQLSLPELTLKKDEVKIYETQQGLNGYF